MFLNIQYIQNTAGNNGVLGHAKSTVIKKVKEPPFLMNSGEMTNYFGTSKNYNG